jgi:large subunit ribosomal protein L11
MAEKKPVRANLKLKIRGGQANAAPPVGSTLGQYGVNMMDFINPFNEQTKDLMGQMVTVHITIYVDKGSGEPNKVKLEKKLSQSQLTEIAQTKADDMNTDDVEAIKKMVAGTARSMGIEVEG